MSKINVMRMADGICKNGWFWHERQTAFPGMPGPAELLEAQIQRYATRHPRYVVDDVFDVYKTISDNGGWWQHDKQAQRAIPPYPAMWAEYTVVHPDSNKRFFYGCMIDTFSPSDWDGNADVLNVGHENCKWIVRYFILQCHVERNGKFAWGKLGETFYYYDSIGSFLRIATILPEKHEFNIKEISQKDMSDWILSQTIPFSHAVSLMNHKSFESRSYELPNHVRRRSESQYEKPILSYKTLWVDCFERIKREGESTLKDGEFRDARQHLVSGHFKYYTPERPLFGRKGQHGWIWNDAHVRGNPELGTVVKDYAIVTR